MLNRAFDKIPNPSISQIQMFILIVTSGIAACFFFIYTKYMISGFAHAAPLDLCYGVALFSLSFSTIFLCFRVKSSPMELIQIKSDLRYTCLWGAVIGLVGSLLLFHAMREISASLVGTAIVLIVPPATLLTTFK